jgi:ATP-binding cassette subfamily B (MDR/TAP) protein 1
VATAVPSGADEVTLGKDDKLKDGSPSVDVVVGDADSADETATLRMIEATEAKLEDQSFSLAWIWELSRPEAGYFLGGLLGALFVGAAFPLLGYLIADMISVSFDPDPASMRQKANQLAYIFIGLAGSQLLGAFLAQYCFGVITERLAKRVREKSFLKMLQMDVSWFDRPEVTAGVLAQQLATECVQIKALTGERTSTSLSQIVTLAVSLAISFYLCWEMTLVMLGLFPVIGLAFGIQAHFINNALESSNTSTNEAGGTVSQALMNIRTIGSFGLETVSIRTFEQQLLVPMKQQIKKGMLTGAGMGFGQVIILGGAGLAYYVGGQLVGIGRATFPEVIAVILCIMFGAIGWASSRPTRRTRPRRCRPRGRSTSCGRAAP